MSIPSTRINCSICLFCGLPGSGKSTLLNNLVPGNCKVEGDSLYFGFELDKLLPHHTIFKPDDGQYENSSKFDFQHEKKSWKFYRHQVLLIVEALLQNLTVTHLMDLSNMPRPEEVDSDFWLKLLPYLKLMSTLTLFTNMVLVIDDNMYYRSMRYEYFKLAKKYNSGFCQVFFNTSVSTAIERNRDRVDEKRVPDTVIVRMAEKLEPPDSTNHPWEKDSFIINTENPNLLNLEPVITMMMESLCNPVPSSPQVDEEQTCRSQIECAASMIHQADLILRKSVALWIAQGESLNGSPADKRSKATQARKAKSVILARLKENPYQFGVSEEWTVDIASSNPSCCFHKFILEMFSIEVNK